MLDIKELREGNKIAYDYDIRRKIPKCFLQGWIKAIKGTFIVFENGSSFDISRCEGIPFTPEILVSYGFKSSEICKVPTSVKYEHQFQNYYFDKVGQFPQIKCQS
jgi:hypothetical protein